MADTKQRQPHAAALRSGWIESYKPHAGLLMLYLIAGILSAAAVVLSVQLRTEFIDVVLEDSGAKKAILKLLLQNLIVVFGIRFFFPALQSHWESVILQRMSLKLECQAAEKKCTIAWACHEDAGVQDTMELIKDIPNQMWLYFKGIGDIISAAVSTAGVFYLMMQLGIAFVAFLFLLLIPVAYCSIRAATGYYDTWQRTAKLRRYSDYERDLLMDKEYATERILFAYTPFFFRRWESDYRQVRSLSLQEELKGSQQMQISGIAFCLYIAVLIFVLVHRLKRGQITAGYAVSLISVFPTLANQMVITLSSEINQIARARRAIAAWMEFQALNDEEGAFDLPQQGTGVSEILFCGVSFRYPNTEKWVLKDINLRFERGQHYAIVGENGAGKSTLIKLLLGLYQATEGEILIDGININAIPRGQLRGMVTALFQDHQRYYTTVAESIGIGDIHRVYDRSCIEDSAAQAGVHQRIEAMPQGYDTPLGSMHAGGIELSGGEWQKLAVSRLIVSPCPVKILDEPTAAMDPMFEYELYQEFHKIMEGRTTISISHRLASCRAADYVYVLDCGSVLEQGTHEQLMEDGQLYCTMYTTQRDMYR